MIKENQMKMLIFWPRIKFFFMINLDLITETKGVFLKKEGSRQHNRFIYIGTFRTSYASVRDLDEWKEITFNIECRFSYVNRKVNIYWLVISSKTNLVLHLHKIIYHTTIVFSLDLIGAIWRGVERSCLLARSKGQRP